VRKIQEVATRIDFILITDDDKKVKVAKVVHTTKLFHGKNLWLSYIPLNLLTRRHDV